MKTKKGFRTTKKYAAGGKITPTNILSTASGIMPMLADYMDDGKASGANVGTAVGSGLGLAANFIPGGQFIAPLLPMVGNLIGGLFDKPEHHRKAFQDVGMNSQANRGEYLFAQGGMPFGTPIQAEQGENMYMPQSNQVSDLGVDQTHNQMSPNDITNMVPSGGYIFPSHASAPEKKRSGTQWKKLFEKLGMEDMLKGINLSNGKKYAMADLSEMFDRKFTPKDKVDSGFGADTEKLMDENKQQAMQALMLINEMDKQQSGPSGDIVSMALGGFVPNYGGGGPIKPLTTGKSLQFLSDYEAMKDEYYYNNALARYASWYISQLPKNAAEPTASELINAFNKAFASTEKDNVGEENPNETKKQADFRRMGEFYENKLKQEFPGKGYDKYPEVQASAGILGVTAKNMDADMAPGAEKIAKTDMWRNKTVMPFTHRTDIVKNIDGSLKSNMTEQGRRGLETSFYFNTSAISAYGDQEYSGSAAYNALANLKNLNPLTKDKKVSDELVKAQEISKQAGYNNRANPNDEASRGRLETPTFKGVPEVRYFYNEQDKNGKRTGREIVLPAKNSSVSFESALKEYKKTGQHYGIYTEGYAQEGSLWQKVVDKQKDYPNKTPEEIKVREEKKEANTSPGNNATQTKNVKSNGLKKRIEEGQPATEKEWDKMFEEENLTPEEWDILRNKYEENNKKYIKDNVLNSGTVSPKNASFYEDNRDLFSAEEQARIDANIQKSKLNRGEPLAIIQDKVEQGKPLSQTDENFLKRQVQEGALTVEAYTNLTESPADKFVKAVESGDKKEIEKAYEKIAYGSDGVFNGADKKGTEKFKPIFDRALNGDEEAKKAVEYIVNEKRVSLDSPLFNGYNSPEQRDRLLPKKQETSTIDPNIVRQYEVAINEVFTTPDKYTSEVNIVLDKLRKGIEPTQEEMDKALSSQTEYGAQKLNEIAKAVKDKKQIPGMTPEYIKSYDEKNKAKEPYKRLRDKVDAGQSLTPSEKDELYSLRDGITYDEFNYVIDKSSKAGVETTNISAPQNTQAPAIETPAVQNVPTPVTPQDVAKTEVITPPPAQQTTVPELVVTPSVNNNPVYQTPSLWSGTLLNPNSIPQGQGVPVMPPGYDYNQVKTQTVIPQEDTLSTSYNGIPQPDLSRFGIPVQNDNPTFYDTPDYINGRYNKGAEVKPFQYFNEDVNSAEYPWNNQQDMKASDYNKQPKNFGQGFDPTILAQFAGDTMALFSNMRQKAPKLRGYSDAPYRAMYDQQIPRYDFLENMSGRSRQQGMEAIRGSVSNPILASSMMSHANTQGLEPLSNAAAQERARIDQIRSQQLGGINQVMQQNTNVGNQNMEYQTMLGNAKKSAVASYGQSVAKNLAERRQQQEQNQLYAGLYANSYPFAEDLNFDNSSFLPRFGRKRKI